MIAAGTRVRVLDSDPDGLAGKTGTVIHNGGVEFPFPVVVAFDDEASAGLIEIAVPTNVFAEDELEVFVD